MLSEFFEIVMLISFGLSWPAAVFKSYKMRSTKGKSLFFSCMIPFGYASGIVSKFLLGLENVKWYVLFFYFLNLFMVSVDLVLYFRNRRLEKKAAEAESK